MGTSISECRDSCDEECERERKCYVDQGEVKIGTFDVMNYPQGTRINNAIGRQHSLVADLAAAAMPGAVQGGANRTGAPPPGAGNSGVRLRPQSVTWADGFIRHTGNLLGRFQLTPKASSFSAATGTDRGPLSFKQQMTMVQAHPSNSQATRLNPR